MGPAWLSLYPAVVYLGGYLTSGQLYRTDPLLFERLLRFRQRQFRKKSADLELARLPL